MGAEATAARQPGRLVSLSQIPACRDLEGGIEADVDMTDEELSEDESDDDSDAGGCSVM